MRHVTLPETTGILNTPNCNYDGGDCCAYSCRKGSAVGNETINLDEIYKWTNDSTVIAELLASEYGANNTIDYSYSCASASFVCLDPAAVNASLTCDAVAVPTTDTNKNASCGNFELDPRYGDGFCDPDLNYQECNYDGGDCCGRTCRVSRLIPGSCSPASLQNCRDPTIGNRALAYINPPKVFRECHPFIYDNGLRNVRLITKVNAAISVCDQRDIDVTEVGDFYTSGTCPGNFTIRQVWRITDTNTSATGEQEQLITVSATEVTPYNPRPIALWRWDGETSSLDNRRYSLGLLQSSPFFDFTEQSFCTGSFSLAFVSCVNRVAGSASQCVYDAVTGELALISAQDGDLWQVNVQRTDTCGLTSVVSSPILLSGSHNDTMPATINVDGTEYIPMDTSVCRHNTVTAQLPSPENKLVQSHAQVCTQVVAEALPAPKFYATNVTGSQTLPSVHVCLRATRQPSQCAGSATSGRLRAFFFDTRDFGVEDPGEIGVIDSTIKVATACLSSSSAGTDTLSSCSSWRVRNNGDADLRQYNLAFEVDATSFVSVSGETDVGCFFLQAANITAPTVAWEVGLVYSHVNGNAATTSTMVGHVCAADPVPIPTLVNMERNVVSTRIPSSTTDGSDALACIAIDPPILIDSTTVSMCFATTTQYPGCASSTGAGRLDRIFLDSAPFGVSDPDLLNFESGPLVDILRPYCTRHQGNVSHLSLICGSHEVRDPPPVRGASVTVALPISNVMWQSSNQHLGCFYVTNPDLYGRDFSSTQFQNWPFAFYFSRLENNGYNATGAASMGGMAFSDPLPADAPSTATSCESNDVTIRVPQGDKQGNTSQVSKHRMKNPF